MRNINAVTFSVGNQRNEEQLEVPSVNRNHGIDLKTISPDFPVFFADGLFIESEDEEHNFKDTRDK